MLIFFLLLLSPHTLYSLASLVRRRNSPWAMVSMASVCRVRNRPVFHWFQFSSQSRVISHTCWSASSSLMAKKQKDVFSNLLTNTQGLCSSHLRSFSLQAVELPPQFGFVSSYSCLRISLSNKNMKGSSVSLVSRDMQIKTTMKFDFTIMARTKKLGVQGEAYTLLLGV